MGAFSVNAQELSLATAQNARPIDNSFSTLAEGIIGASDTLMRKKAAEDKSAQLALVNSTKDEAAIDALSIEDSRQREAEYYNQMIRDAEASGDQKRITAAMEQSRRYSVQFAQASRAIMLKKLAHYKELGLANEYLSSFNEISGKKTADLGSVISPESEEVRRQEKMYEQAQDILRAGGYVPTGDRSLDTSRFVKLQSELKEAQDLARSVQNDKNRAIQYWKGNAEKVSVTFGQFHKNLLDKVKTGDKETRQMAYDALLRTADFGSAIRDAVNVGMLDKKTGDALISTNTLLGGSIAESYTQSFNVYKDVADTFLKGGASSVQQEADMKMMQNQGQMALFEIAKRTYGDSEVALAATRLSSISPEAANSLYASFKSFQDKSVIQNIEAAQATANVLKAVKREKPALSVKDEGMVEAVTKSITLSTQSTDVAEKISALKAVDSEFWTLIPEGQAKSSLQANVDLLATSVKDQVTTLLGGEELMNYYSIRMDDAGNVRLVPRTGAPKLDPTVKVKLEGTKMINAIINAYSVTHSITPEEAATEVFQTPVQRESVKSEPIQDKTSSLDLSGLDESDVLDIQSYILELKAKQKRSAMVS